MKKLLISGSIILLALPMFVGAQLEAPNSSDFNLTFQRPLESDVDITSPTGVVQLLLNLLQWVQVFFWIAAVFFGLYAAFLYLTARGNSEKVSQANYMLIYTVVAIVVAVVAYAIPPIVTGFITS